MAGPSWPRCAQTAAVTVLTGMHLRGGGPQGFFIHLSGTLVFLHVSLVHVASHPPGPFLCLFFRKVLTIFIFWLPGAQEVVAGRPCGLDGELSQCPFHHIYRLEQVTGPAQTGCARGPCRGTNAGRWGSLGFLSKDERCVLGAFSCSLHAIFVL